MIKQIQSEMQKCEAKMQSKECAARKYKEACKALKVIEGCWTDGPVLTGGMSLSSATIVRSMA